MFRLLSVSRVPRCSPATFRTFATPALPKSWDNNTFTIAELRVEAKARGLSAKGNKLNLVSRLNEYEKSIYTPPAVSQPSSNNSLSIKSNVLLASKTANPVAASVNMAGTRESSSLSSVTSPSAQNPTEAPGNPEPPVVPTATYSLEITLPDLSQRAPLPPAQPPYVPDFWDSSVPPMPVSEEESLPKMVVVGGAATHHGGGPTHSSVEPRSTEETTSTPAFERTDSVLDDIAEDLGLPPVAAALKKQYSSLSRFGEMWR